MTPWTIAQKFGDWGCLGVLLLTACGSTQDASAGGSNGVGDEAGGAAPTGGELGECQIATPPASAPGGYFVDRNKICTEDGRVHLFHGVNRPGLEYSPTGDHFSARDFRLMASWGANVVRMGLNQDFWLAASPQFDPGYAKVVDEAVTMAEEAGLDVILDLHWSDAGVLGSCSSGSCQQQMSDDNSLSFWSEVASRYHDDGRVSFELYNEPHDISWATWRSGGATTQGFRAVGMQQLYDTVRQAGANNLVIIGGLDWAYQLSGVVENRIAGYNIAYATHPYNTPERQPASWDASWGFLTETDPVIATEFGNLNDPSCTPDYAAAVIQYADSHAAGWTAWAWYPGGCKYPALIDDWQGKPTALGQLIQTALLSYGGPHPAVEPEVDTPLLYTFDHDAEGWALNNYQDPDFTNLGSKVPDGVTPATLTYERDEGDPKPGALELAVTISANNQYVLANAQVAENLVGQTLHARVRLKSGTLNGAGVSLNVCTTSDFVCAEGPAADPAALASGEWASLEWALSTATDPDFDASQVVLLGVVVDAAVSTEAVGPDGAFVSAAEAVLQIDSVRD